MDIIISNASDKPIYDQIVSQMKALILTGELGEGAAACPPSEHWPATCASASSRPSARTPSWSPRLHRDGARQGQLRGRSSLKPSRAPSGIESCSSRPSTKRAARTSASRSSMTCSTSSRK
ncbi:MAG: hypothetical protein ACLTMP_05775 [Eggerthella lenta]